MRTRPLRRLAACLALTTIPVLGAPTAHAAEEAGPPQPEAHVMTRTCEQGGALVVMSNPGGGSVTFNVLVNNEASGTHPVGAGAQATQLVPIAEDQVMAIQVTADGMAPVAATRTRDCEGAAPAAADSAGATDPVDAVPAGTPPPEAMPTAVAGAADTPTATGAGDAAGPDSTLAPATDPAAPAGALPFTGPAALGWLSMAGLLLIGSGALVRRSAARD